MGSNGKKKCMKCGLEYPKKLLFCPKCNAIDSRRASQIRDLELKVYHNPEIGLRCKKCGTLFPSDISKCPYCGNSSETGAKPLLKNGLGGNFETPMTKHFKSKPYSIKANNKTVITANNSPSIKLINCKCCNRPISTRAEVCPNCGNPTGVHTCPKCGSINTKIISGASKVSSIFMWGIFAANKVMSNFQCKDCGQKF